LRRQSSPNVVSCGFPILQIPKRLAGLLVPETGPRFRHLADWPKWLGETPATTEELQNLLTPSADGRLKVWRVDKAVGNVRNKGRRHAQAV